MYRERIAAAAGAVLWQREARAGAVTRILPDGCLDLIWDGSQLVVAGPDSRARLHAPSEAARYTALRFSGGLGPALIGIPADELRDVTLALDQLWPQRRARAMTERVAVGPAAALDGWLVEESSRCELDPLGPRILEMARAGTTVPDMAAHVGLSPRQLHRRCLTLFGYGPRHLVRVLRLERALAGARGGSPLASVAYDCGFADQAHFARDVRDLTGVTATRLLAGSAG
jgi:AraC-like DNA-binding protein